MEYEIKRYGALLQEYRTARNMAVKVIVAGLMRSDPVLWKTLTPMKWSDVEKENRLPFRWQKTMAICNYLNLNEEEAYSLLERAAILEEEPYPFPSERVAHVHYTKRLERPSPRADIDN